MKPGETTALGPLRIGVSACILGELVRFDGQHKLDRFVRDTLGQYVEFVPVCPEVELGLGVPRETVRLEDDGTTVRMIAPKSGTDHTASMSSFARRRVAELEELGLCGYVLQKGSPSCGMERVRIYPSSGGPPRRNGRGLFAQTLSELLPDLPMEEDGRLNDIRLRENFIERIFAFRRLRALFSGRWRTGDLVAFHAQEKLLLLAHDPPTYRELGRLVANAKATPRAELSRDYQHLFLLGMKRQATTRKHTNVLQHMAGYFKRVLDSADRAELVEVIERYRLGYVPLVVPLTLLNHFLRRHPIPYLEQQSYLRPHPEELMLRNHV
ncbi:MAG: DUF523 and DUF1722 domain-containing protein [Deltaproteobacteria bacterium]|nr:DUF523 and DUF1722 domain-containing protein [Deltaproteobacteria bacterium]